MKTIKLSTTFKSKLPPLIYQFQTPNDSKSTLPKLTVLMRYNTRHDNSKSPRSSVYEVWTVTAALAHHISRHCEPPAPQARTPLLTRCFFVGSRPGLIPADYESDDSTFYWFYVVFLQIITAIERRMIYCYHFFRVWRDRNTVFT